MTSNNKYLTNLFFNTFIFLITFLIFITRVLLQSGQKKNKKTLVSGNVGDVKNLPPGGRKFIIFNRFSGDVLFSSLVSFVFFYYCFFCLFICCFLKLKMYILIHIRLSRRVSHKKIFTRPISGNKTIFFLGSPCYLFYCMYIP